MDQSAITGKQLAAARALADKTQAELAKAASISVPTLKRMEGASGPVPGMVNNVAAVVRALEAAGIAFLDGDYSGSGGPGVRLIAPAGKSIDADDTQAVQYREHLVNDAPPGAGG